MSFEAWGSVWIGCAVLPIVAAILFKARNWWFCLLAIGAAVWYAAIGFSNLSWLAITIATGSVALNLWEQERGAR
ncbi:hypothetical protein [Burkholderia ambifaria]|uniref:hypothetical protein n=1 Tax=Burkholderia ambifaria TaxID=152480 RepID=UPI00158840C1|nr:hypothetical protein [Burkholderia ambifaria]